MSGISSQSPTKILILGAGELGTAVIQALSTPPSPFHLTLLVRPSVSPSPAEKYASLLSAAQGLSLCPFDISTASVSSLASIFTPFDTIVSCTGFTSPLGMQQKIADAVLEAGNKYFVPWQFGVDYECIGRGSGMKLFDEQLDVRESLRKGAEKGVEWMVLSTGCFASFLVEPESDFVVSAGGEEGGLVVRGLGSWDTMVAVTMVEDIGVVLREILLRTPRPQGIRMIFGRGVGVSWPVEKTWNFKNGIVMTDLSEYVRRKYSRNEHQ